MTYFSGFHTMAGVTFHSVSVWLTVYLACYRHFYLKAISINYKKDSSEKSKLVIFYQEFLMKFRTKKCTKIFIILIYLFCIILCIPAYIYPTVRNNSYVSNNESLRYYYVDQSDLNIKTNGSIFKILFYSQAIVAKILPCIILVVFISLLINSLALKNKNHNKLDMKHLIRRQTHQMVSLDLKKNEEIIESNMLIPLKKFSEENCENNIETIKIVSTSQTNTVRNHLNSALKSFSNNKMNDNFRTTLMLLSVCILFIITELPQSIFILLSIIMGNNFYDDAYTPLGDLFDIIALVNNSINFLMYCLMSRIFRNTFWNIFFCKNKK
jgi:hypothetical protein